MNLFDLPSASDEDMAALGWGGAAAMLTEGADMANIALDAAIDELQNFLVELRNAGILEDSVLYKLASMEQACFTAIHQHGTLEAMAKITTMFSATIDKYTVEQERIAKEGA